jgi:hypothetical protein
MGCERGLSGGHWDGGGGGESYGSSMVAVCRLVDGCDMAISEIRPVWFPVLPSDRK